MKRKQPTLACAICHMPIRMTRRGWAHVSPLGKFWHTPIVLDGLLDGQREAEQAAEEARG